MQMISSIKLAMNLHTKLLKFSKIHAVTNTWKGHYYFLEVTYHLIRENVTELLQIYLFYFSITRKEI